MAQPVALFDILELRILGRMNNQRLMNVLHYRLERVGASVLDGIEVISKMNEKLMSPVGGVIEVLRGMSNPAWSYEGCVYQWIHPNRYVSVRINDGAGAGLLAGVALPQNVASVLTKRSQFGSRHGIGSIHLGGMGAGDVTNGLLTVTRISKSVELADVLTVSVDMSDLVADAEMEPIILNKAAPADSYDFHDITIQNTVRVQRRRTVGLGE